MPATPRESRKWRSNKVFFCWDHFGASLNELLPIKCHVPHHAATRIVPSMQDDWQRILAWVRTHALDIMDELNPPADRAELAEAERRLSMRLPTVFRAFYALHNGTTGFRIFPALDADQSAFGPLSIDEVEF